MLWKLLMASFALYMGIPKTKDTTPIPSELFRPNMTNLEKWDTIEEYIRTHKPFPFLVDL